MYAPTEEAEDDRKEEFYDELSKAVDETSKYDMIILLGDLNAKIGREDCMRNIAGKYTLHEASNESGKLLGQFAAEKHMIIKSTFFDDKIIHKGT